MSGDNSGKRKQGPGGGGPSTKKSKGGHAGKWQTSHQLAKRAEGVELGKKLDVNDAGIWVTYARGMKGKAIREFKTLCEEYGESMFGVKAPKDDEDEKEEDETQDIEASIQQELANLAPKKAPKTRQVFTPIGTGLECIFFLKTMEPIEPLKLIAKICQDAKDCPDPRLRKCKYINRLTPITDTDRATENGIERVARSVLAPHFTLKSESGEDDADKASESQDDGEKKDGDQEAYTYAIRHNIRNHTAFKSDAVIKKIAGLVSSKHKVNLGNPDKVVLVEIFQTFCGMAVVDGKEWDELKRYNMNELYKLNIADKTEAQPQPEAKPESVPEPASEEVATST